MTTRIQLADMARWEKGEDVQWHGSGSGGLERCQQGENSQEQPDDPLTTLGGAWFSTRENIKLQSCTQ